MMVDLAGRLKPNIKNRARQPGSGREGVTQQQLIVPCHKPKKDATHNIRDQSPRL
jgi:hypothetical protein